MEPNGKPSLSCLFPDFKFEALSERKSQFSNQMYDGPGGSISCRQDLECCPPPAGRCLNPPAFVQPVVQEPPGVLNDRGLTQKPALFCTS